MNAASNFNPAELAALLHFYADSGVEWLVDDEPVDRIAQFEAQKAARAQAKAPASAREGSQQEAPSSASSGNGAASRRPGAAAPPPAMANPVAIPAAQAVEAARSAADGAGSLAELKAAIEAFNGCNLKNSARSTVFASGDSSSGIAVIGPMPNADDDRDGTPFSGRAGDLLDRMLAAIGLSRDGVLMTNVIPWRPPGNRMPSSAEMDICQPFIERQIALARPKALLLLGNFPARFFIGGNGTIHTMRGQWQTVSFAGLEIPALATFHPQELLTAPANKALTWQDLLIFRNGLA